MRPWRIGLEVMPEAARRASQYELLEVCAHSRRFIGAAVRRRRPGPRPPEELPARAGRVALVMGKVAGADLRKGSRPCACHPRAVSALFVQLDPWAAAP